MNSKLLNILIILAITSVSLLIFDIATDINYESSCEIQ